MTWPKSGPNYRPASGIPAKGGYGAGWGGPARGKGTGAPVMPLTDERRAKGLAIRRDKEAMEERRAFKESTEERIKQLVDELGDIALNDPNSAQRISAINSALNRLEGLPVATQRNLNVDMTWEEAVKASIKKPDPPKA